jgi:hypothetical protein
VQVHLCDWGNQYEELHARVHAFVAAELEAAA